MALQPQPANLVDYMRQYLKVATNGNVYCEYASHQDRMRLHCKVCTQTLTRGIPESAEKMDWAMQEFVKLHRHVINSPEGKIPSTKADWIAPAPVTADFKPVKPKRDDWGIAEGRKFR